MLERIAAPDDQNSVVSVTLTVRDPDPREVLHTWGRLRSLGESNGPTGVTGRLFAVAQTKIGVQADCDEVRLITLDGATYWNVIFASPRFECAFGDYMGGLGFEYPQDLRGSRP